MVIVGAKGHAKELLEVIRQDQPLLPIYLFDNISTSASDNLYGNKILKTIGAVQQVFEQDASFALGIGSIETRYQLSEKFSEINGKLISVLSSRSYICTDVALGIGSNTMPFSSISNNVVAGKALLLNAYASIHHDCLIGNFVVVSPGARILGGCIIGDFTFIGANATLLPNVQIGTNVVIAAGAVVIKNVPDNTMVAGNPAIHKKQLSPLNL
jgi:sugar O-acyltransferase (sialic acid O-acetyltransferase NeuD family)